MIANFSKVTDNVFRGAQPWAAEDWQQAWDAGIRRVLKLNEQSVGNGDMGASALGAIVETHTILDQDAQTAVQDDIFPPIDTLLDGPGPWLVHCTEGKDRTGIVIARYRVRRCGWSKWAAYEEWIAFGSHRYTGLENAWERWQP